MDVGPSSQRPTRGRRASRLIVGTTGDPATPYAGAKDLVHRLDGSRLLTFVATEHTAYTKNACINDAVDGYLLTGRLPRVGTRCER